MGLPFKFPLNVATREFFLGGTRKNFFSPEPLIQFTEVEMSTKTSLGSKPVIATCFERFAKQILTSRDTMVSTGGPTTQKNQLRSIEDV